MTTESVETTPRAGRLPSPDPRIPHLSATAPLGEILAAIDEAGIVVLHDALSPDVLATINADLDPLMPQVQLGLIDAPDQGTSDFLGQHTKHLNKTLKHSQAIREHVALHPRVMEIAETLLLPNCRNLLLQAITATEIHPGATAQKLHRDDSLWPAPGERYPMSIQAMFAFSDFTAENGATRVIPGSHRWPDAKHFEPENWRSFGRPRADLSPDEVVPVEMPAGSCFVWSGFLFHGGGPNTTADRVRRSLILGYALGWLRTEANQPLVYPPEVAKHFPRKLQELLGYQLHGILGGIEIAEDPISLLED